MASTLKKFFSAKKCKPCESNRALLDIQKQKHQEEVNRLLARLARRGRKAQSEKRPGVDALHKQLKSQKIKADRICKELRREHGETKEIKNTQIQSLAREISELKAELKACKKTNHALKDEINKTKVRSENLVASTERKYNDLVLEQQTLDARNASLQQVNEDLQADRDKLLEQVSPDETRIDELDSQVKFLRSKREFYEDLRMLRPENPQLKEKQSTWIDESTAPETKVSPPKDPREFPGSVPIVSTTTNTTMLNKKRLHSTTRSNLAETESLKRRILELETSKRDLLAAAEDMITTHERLHNSLREWREFCQGP